MNGLKFIRTQCNISLTALATALNVSRQMVSAWETGKKAISEKRLEQLSKYFGVEKEFFLDISENQKKELLNKAMFRWGKGEDEYYLYRCNTDDGIMPETSIRFLINERDKLLSDEYQDKRKKQKKIINQIDKQISGPSDNKLRDQMLFLNRGNCYYGLCYNNMKAAFSKKSEEKMIYYRCLIEIMKSISIAFDAEQLDEIVVDRFEDKDFIMEMSEIIKQHMNKDLNKIKRRIESIKSSKDSKLSKKPETQEKTLTVEEAIEYAEKVFAENKLTVEEGVSEFSVHFKRT